MYISQKISIRIPEEDIGYVYWAAKRYVSAIIDALNIIRRKGAIDLQDREVRNLLMQRYHLHGEFAMKAIKDAWKFIQNFKAKRVRKKVKPKFKPQLSSRGLRTRGAKLDLDRKQIIISIKVPKVSKGKIKWVFKKVYIDLKIRNKTLERIKRALELKLKMTWRILFNSPKNAYLVLSIDYPDPYQLPDTGKLLGIDFNIDNIAACLINEDGNPVYFRTVRINVLYKHRDEKLRQISMALEKILSDLKFEKFTIVIEDLHELIKYTQRARKGISFIAHKRKIAYSLFTKLVEKKAAKNFIPLRNVEPAYTSEIAKVKYKKIYRGRNVHELSALVIARRYRYTERIPIVIATKKLRIASKRGLSRLT